MVAASTTKEYQSEGIRSFHVDEHERAPLKTWHTSQLLLNCEDAFDKPHQHTLIFLLCASNLSATFLIWNINSCSERRDERGGKCGCSARPQLLFQRMKLLRQIGFQRNKMCGATSPRDRSLVEFSPVINNLTAPNLSQLLTCAQPLNGTPDVRFHRKSGVEPLTPL